MEAYIKAGDGGIEYKNGKKSEGRQNKDKEICCLSSSLHLSGITSLFETIKRGLLASYLEYLSLLEFLD